MTSVSTFDIGGRGEDIAMQWLRERGFLIVERNWRVGHYEIDIIAQRYDTLHFIEVKTRKVGGWQTPYEKCLHSIIVLAHEHALQSDSTAVSTRLLISLYICQQLLT